MARIFRTKCYCWPLCLLVLLFATPAFAVTNILVGSSESHSIEKFDTSGVWLKTFASTGPWIPFGIAVSPVTNDVFAATMTGPTANIILRYRSSGAPFGPSGSYWSTFDVSTYFSNNPVQSIAFDSSGNLYVASDFGTDGFHVVIRKFLAAQLLAKVPIAAKTPVITTTTGRGNQMAFDQAGDLCIASFDSPNTVQCYNTSTGALVYDYAPEFAGFSPSIQPVGLAFGPNNNLYVTSVFAGQLVFEQTERTGPMVALASGLVNDIGYIAIDSAGALYVPSFHNPEGRYAGCIFYACMDYDTSSDVIYKVDPNTALVTNFITSHIWGPYQMIFVPF